MRRTKVRIRFDLSHHAIMPLVGYRMVLPVGTIIEIDQPTGRCEKEVTSSSGLKDSTNAYNNAGRVVGSNDCSPDVESADCPQNSVAEPIITKAAAAIPNLRQRQLTPDRESCFAAGMCFGGCSSKVVFSNLSEVVSFNRVPEKFARVKLPIQFS